MKKIRFKLIDLCVCAALFAILAGYCLAAIVRADEAQNRALCAKNLRMIGQALLLYANENRGQYPRTNWAISDNPKPTWGTPYADDDQLGPSTGTGKEAADPFAKDDWPGAKFRPKANDVTAALYLLMRTQDITSQAFVCPSTSKEKWDFGGGMNTALNWTNWNGAKGLRDHLSYSYQNRMHPRKRLLPALSSV